MDDLRRGLVGTLLFFVSLAGGLGHAVDIEYISPEQELNLEKSFQAANVKIDASAVAQRSWHCDMYGVRSRLRVKRNVGLYHFQNSEPALWINRGTQPISSYRLNEGGALIGKLKSLEDQVRLNREGQLVSRLSSASSQARVIAYSLCSPLAQ